MHAYPEEGQEPGGDGGVPGPAGGPHVPVEMKSDGGMRRRVRPCTETDGQRVRQTGTHTRTHTDGQTHAHKLSYTTYLHSRVPVHHVGVLVVLQMDVAEAGERGQEDEAADPPHQLVNPAVLAGAGDGPVALRKGGGRLVVMYMCICMGMVW